MVKHIVFFKLNNKSDIDEVKEKLLTLKENIKEIKNLEVGINFADEQRAYDLALIVELDSKEDLKKYAVDEYHQKVINFIKTKTIDTKVVDFIS